AGQTVREIFGVEGEDEFRRRETDVLREALARRGVVVATGGGALLSPNNRALLREEHVVLCLTCDADEITRRVGLTADRPLIAGRGEEEITKLLETRAPAYARFEQLN